MVHRQSVGAARRMYSARIEGRQPDVTVAVYQGENAEENWKRELAKFSKIWHPNFLQPFGIVHSLGLYATIFSDELVPVRQYIEEYGHSMHSTVYLYAYFTGELQDAIHYIEPLVGNRAFQMILLESATWIRRSVGRLCIELSNTSRNDVFLNRWTRMWPPRIPISDLRGEQESAIISALTLKQYQQTCVSRLAKIIGRKGNHNLQFGAIYCSTGDGDKEIAHIPNFSVVPDVVWETPRGDGSLVAIPNGRTRFTPPCDEQIGTTLSLWVYSSENWNVWLSQANYIFRQYPITAHCEDYQLVSHIKYELTLLPNAEIHPEGYLILCPLDDLQSEDGGFIERPECPAYWSLDPFGCERLSPEEAFAHGFPSFGWQRIVSFKSWDERVYASLSQFHAGKGFDPYSQDIALHLGYPLYELSYGPGTIGARIEEIPPEPGLDLGNSAAMADEDITHHEDAHDEIQRNCQKNNESVIAFPPQKTETVQRLSALDSRFMYVVALGAVAALLFAYLCTL
ncbi:hypothetical protein B0H11DRAFT_1963952 [Mycena galericulata]|nr:hypothetical protein B0H11DRAFT_1963952 [Mycena galericulata]